MDTCCASHAPRPVTAVRAAAPIMAQRHFLGRLAFETDPADVAAHLATCPGELVLVDTRTRDAYAASHLPGAISLPHAEIEEAAVAALPAGALVVTYCWGPACNAATKGAARIAAAGLPVKEMLGGIAAWEAEGLPLHGAPADREVA
ncbi:rhodanese-like domain-containing protein [soil metagenome]